MNAFRQLMGDTMGSNPSMTSTSAIANPMLLPFIR